MTAAAYQATLARLQPYAPHVKAWTTTILPLTLKGMPTTDPNHEKVQRMIRTGGQWEQMIAGQPAPEQLAGRQAEKVVQARCMMLRSSCNLCGAFASLAHLCNTHNAT